MKTGVSIHIVECFRVGACFCIYVALAAAVWAQDPASGPDLILRHGHIFTGTPEKPWVEAVAISGDHIVATGTDAVIVASADRHTQIIDLQGAMAMPGINDSHDHVGGAPYGVEARTRRPAMADPSIIEIADAVRAAAVGAKPGEWITAQVGPAAIRHARETRKAMDEAGGGHPIMLEAWWGHGIMLNAAGLAKLGIDDSAKELPGGRYDRDPEGHLTGLLEENTGNAIRRRLSSQMGVAPAIGPFRGYAQHRLEQGVTSVQVMATNQRLSDLEKVFVEAQTPLRLRIMRFPMPAEDALDHERLGVGEEKLTPLIRVAGVKWMLDGTPIEELAFQTKDYADRPGWRGRPNFSTEFIDAQLKIALTGKDQLMMHIVGDAMTDEVMDEMEKLAPAERWRPLRVRFEHGDGFTTPERMARAKKLGIVIAQPRPGRPFRALVEAGIPLAYGSDGGMAPFFMFARMTDAHDPQSISREEASKILTAGSAYAEFQERKKGVLAPGMLADIAVLSQDLMTAPTAALPGTKSVLTVVGGKVVYRAQDAVNLRDKDEGASHE
jgi:predicted amidohydrolase YtcJ